MFLQLMSLTLDCKVYRTSHEDDDLKEWLTEHVPEMISTKRYKCRVLF